MGPTHYPSLKARTDRFFRGLLSCCSDVDERPALQIGNPTNFRREDVSIPGLDSMQQRLIRDRAIADAAQMWPTPTTPTSTSTATTTTLRPQPMYAAAPMPRDRDAAVPLKEAGAGAIGRVRVHSRKISDGWRQTVLAGYRAVAPVDEAHVAPQTRYEMRALADGGGPRTFERQGAGIRRKPIDGLEHRRFDADADRKSLGEAWSAEVESDDESA